jgi:hypothetical protein
MADKKVTPKNPAKDSAKQSDTKATERKTATSRFHPRKTSGIRRGG